METRQDMARTFELHLRAVDQGLVSSSERDRLRFVALAEHARRVGRPDRPRRRTADSAQCASVTSTEATWAQTASVSSDRSAQRLIPQPPLRTSVQRRLRGGYGFGRSKFLFLMKFLGWLMRPKKLDEAAPALSRPEELLTEVRDLLKVPRERST
jgi:hypothetical protein